MLHPKFISNPTTLALALSVAFCAAMNPAAANPTGAVVVHGQAALSNPQANTLLVTTQNGPGSNHSAINWQSFSIPAGNTTRFVQPDAGSTSINRVVTNTPSVLFGSLSSNGKLVLVNQSGIAVGNGAVVDTAGFTASTVGMSELDAIAGRLRFGGAGLGDSLGALQVQGNIVARGGDVVLIAPSVELAKSALVESQGGSVILAAGQRVAVTGRGLEGISMEVQAPSDAAVNLGTLKGDAVGIFAGQLKHSGLIQASQANLEGGRVVLKASGDAMVEADGTILAGGTQGGQVDVLGQRVALTDRASVDVSGERGGGSIRIGGDYQGQNAKVPNAMVTFAGSETRLAANATAAGQGGKVIVWADDTTRYYGQASARAGAASGDGGFVEVSGKRYLDFQGRVDTSAARGKTGTLLLDPTELRIASLSSVNITPTAATNFNFDPTSAGIPSILDVATLVTQLGLTNVDINVLGGLDYYIRVTDPVAWTSASALTLKAGTAGAIILEASINAGPTGTLKLDAGTGGISQLGTAPVLAPNLKVVSAGPVALNANNNVGTLAGSVTGPGFSFTNVNDLTVGTVGISGLTVSSGDVFLTVSGPNKKLTITNPVTASAGSVSYTADHQAHAAATTTGGGSNWIEIKPDTPTAAIEFSSSVDVVGVLRLSGAALLGFSTPLLKVGNISNTAGIQVKEPVTASSFSSMSLITSGAIGQDAGSTLTLPNLNADGALGVALLEANNVTNLAGHVGPSAAARTFAFTDVSAINIGSVDIINGIQNDGGVGSAVMLTAGATVTQSASAPVVASAGSLYVSAIGGINLSLPGVNTPISVVLNNTVSGNVAYVGQTPALTVSAASAPGSVKIETSGGLVIPLSTVISAGAVGDAVILGAAGGPFTMDPASGISTPSGRHLLYLADPAGGHSYGPLTMGAGDFKQYAASWGSAPAQVTGNGRLFAVTPVLNSVLGGGVSKTYDGTTTIALTGATFAAPTGHIDGDTGGVIFATSGILANPNVGSGILVSANLPTLAGVLGGGGTYPVYGYGASASGSIGQISPLAVSTTVNLTGSRVYDGTNVVDARIFSIGGLVGSETLTLSGAGTVADKNVGVNKPVTLGSLVLGDGTGSASNYTFAGGLHLASISPLALTAISGMTANNKTYDGSASATLSLASASLSGLLGSDGVTVAGATAAFSDKNAGVAKKVNLTGLTLAGADAGNYSLSLDRLGGLSADISPATLTAISGVTAENKVYDGTAAAALKVDTAVFAGQVAGDKLLVAGARGVFGDKNAGLGKMVQISGMTLSGTDAINYRYMGTSTATTTADIAKAPITVSGGITADNKVYDGTVTAQVNLIGGTLAGKLPGDDLTLAGALGAFSDKNAGSGKTVSLSELRFTGADAINYKLADGPAPTTQADITKATLSGVTAIAAANKVYDGTIDASLDLSKAVLTGQVAGDNIQVTSATGRFDDKNAGTAKNVAISGIALAGSDLANYTFGDLGTSRTQANITPKPLTSVAGITAVNKVYDGTTDATLATGAATFDGKLVADQLAIVGATGAFADRHVGTGKKVTIIGLTLSGLDARNYTFSAANGDTLADITVRPVSTWTGAVDRQWANPGNWDALPDGVNVLAVSIPAGAAAGVVYDTAAGVTSLQSVNSVLPLSLTGGTLNVSGSASLGGLEQSGGNLLGGGSLRVNGRFSQTGGAVKMGAIEVLQPSGDLTFSALSAPTVSIDVPGGTIRQTGPVTTAQLKTSSASGTELTNRGNRINSFEASNSGLGDVTLVNTGDLRLLGIVNQDGNIRVDNTGKTVTVGAIKALHGTATLDANSPLTIGPGGVTSSGDIGLSASNRTSAGDLTLEGDVVSTRGAIVINAGHDLVQNSRVSGALGVTATAGGTIVFGPFATTSYPPISYTANGQTLTPPPEPETRGRPVDFVVAFLDRFDRAVESQHRRGADAEVDPRRRRETDAGGVVTEGEICRP
jgi:filamentous hemagglutinin family protein